MKYAPFSFSKIDSWLTCPRKFCYQYIIKPATVLVPNFHLEKGDLTHAIVENILKGTIKDFTPKFYETLDSNKKKTIYTSILDFCKHKRFQELKNAPGKRLIEVPMYLDYNLKPQDAKDENTLIRGKVDYVTINDDVNIIDWKTGGGSIEKINKWPRKRDQLEFYGIWGLQKFNADMINAYYVYVDFNVYKSHPLDKDDLGPLKEKWLQVIDSIENDEEFPKKESKLCDYCDFQPLCSAEKHIFESSYFSIDALETFDEISGPY